jgi:hypothetical protein
MALKAPESVASSPLKQQTQAIPANFNFPHPKTLPTCTQQPPSVVSNHFKNTRECSLFQLGFSLCQVGESLPKKSSLGEYLLWLLFGNRQVEVQGKDSFCSLEAAGERIFDCGRGLERL